MDTPPQNLASALRWLLSEIRRYEVQEEFVEDEDAQIHIKEMLAQLRQEKDEVEGLIKMFEMAKEADEKGE